MRERNVPLILGIALKPNRDLFIVVCGCGAGNLACSRLSGGFRVIAWDYPLPHLSHAACLRLPQCGAPNREGAISNGVTLLPCRKFS
uniref:Uncharacterized protein n=1 Tax=Solibacter usitatus (strain Ellin6076) TaxID=234267 RepID=Q026F1_SOLUE